MKFRLLSLVLLIALALVSVVPLAGQEATQCEAGFRLFDHERLATEPVCIPENPQRIASLDPFATETLIALNRLPAAIDGIGAVLRRLPELQDRLTDVVNLGDETMSLETLLIAQPDLIITISGNYDEILDQLRAIAPTVVLEFNHSGEWKDMTRTYGEIINAQAEVNALLDLYDDRLQTLREQLGEQPPVVSVVRAYPDRINLYLRDSFPGTILQDAGIPRPDSQNYDMNEAAERFENPIQYSISRETLRDADADIIITWVFGGTAEIAEDARAQLDDLFDDPLWNNLQAVQNGQVYQGGSYWIGSGILAAHRVVDDLFRYVAGVDPAEVAPNPFLTDEVEATQEPSN
jgi:iron complex transport system substrate-binding protein